MASKFIEVLLEKDDHGPVLEAARRLLAAGRAPSLKDARDIFRFVLQNSRTFPLAEAWAGGRLTYSLAQPTRARLVLLHKEVGTEVRTDGGWRQGARTDLIPAVFELLLGVASELTEAERVALTALARKQLGKREKAQARAGSKKERAYLRLAALAMIDAQQRDIALRCAWTGETPPADLLQVFEDQAAEQGFHDRFPDFAALGLGVDRLPILSTLPFLELKAIPTTVNWAHWSLGGFDLRVTVGGGSVHARSGDEVSCNIGFAQDERRELLAAYVTLDVDVPGNLDLLRRMAGSVKPPSGPGKLVVNVHFYPTQAHPAVIAALASAGLPVIDSIRAADGRVLGLQVPWP